MDNELMKILLNNSIAISVLGLLLYFLVTPLIQAHIDSIKNQIENSKEERKLWNESYKMINESIHEAKEEILNEIRKNK